MGPALHLRGCMHPLFGPPTRSPVRVIAFRARLYENTWPLFEGIVGARSLADLVRMAEILGISPEKPKAAKPKYAYSAWTLWANLVARGSR